MFGIPSGDPHFLRSLHDLAVLDAAPAAPPANPIPQASDDGFHFSQFRSGPSDEWYTEWWYYNFYDPASGDAAILVYQVTNPGNVVFPTCQAMMMATYFPGDGGEPIVERRSYDFEEFSATPDRADVILGVQNRILSPEAGRQTLRADLDRLSFELEYTNLGTPAWLARGSRGPREWELAYWMSLMPNARVQGTVGVDGRRLTLQNASGYHDHNWGKWLWPARSFLWVAFANAEKRLSLDLGVGNGFSPGYTAVLQRGDEVLEFPFDAHQPARPSDYRRVELWHYPGRVEIDRKDRSGRYSLALSWEVRQNAVVARIPLLLLEQRSLISGAVTDSQTGEVFRFSEEGFSEWTVTYV